MTEFKYCHFLAFKERTLKIVRKSLGEYSLNNKSEQDIVLDLIHVEIVLNQINSDFPIDELNSWVGFIQGVLVTRRLTTLKEEILFIRSLLGKETSLKKTS